MRTGNLLRAIYFFSKNDFGEINWTLAVLLTSFSILSLGIDQVTVKKIAEGINPQKMLSLYFLHILLAGSLFYSTLLIVHFTEQYKENDN